MDCFRITATIRASLGIYNTREDIDVLVRALDKVRAVFA
jgi:cysteine desulfurase/selenocysteine lyase